MYKNISVRVILVLVLVLSVCLGVPAGAYAAADNKDKKAMAAKPAAQDPAKTRVLNLLKKGDDASIGQALEYLASKPDDGDVLSLLAETYIGKNNLPAAENAIKKAMAAQPGIPYYDKVSARVNTLKAISQGNLDLALEQVNKGLAANPGDSTLLSDKRKVYVAQAKNYVAQNDAAKANVALDAAIALSNEKEKPELVAMKEMVNKPAAVQPKPKE